jgi:hypothetical protein
VKTSSKKAKVYVCSDCKRVFNNYNSHNAHKRHCGKSSGWINGDGYKMIQLPNGKRVREHRYIMELNLGRPLLKSEHIHHKNGDKLDNNILNLQIISIKYHGHISGKQALGIPKGSAWNYNKTKRVCNRCKKDFLTSPSHKRKFCSRRCYIGSKNCSE